MLTRSSQIGEFYVMAPPQVFPGEGKCEFSCDLLIYDEESDRHVRIQWGEALGACLTINNDDVISKGANSTTTGKDWKAAAEKWAAFNKGYKGGTAAVAADTATGTPEVAAKAGTSYTAGDYETLDKEIRIVVARPFIEHLMHNAILTVAGRDTGATLFGPADMCVPLRVQTARAPTTHSPFALTRALSRPLAGSSRPTRRSRPSKDITPAISRRSSPSLRT